MPLRVLIVDDNEDAADSLATLVELWGHTPTVAYDGEVGLRAAREWSPDCLILDINMPKLDGYNLAERVRREPGLGQAKLVAVSAYSHPDHARRAEAVGFDYWLVKPAAPDELERLLAKIENILKPAEKTEELSRKNAPAERTEELVQKNVALAGAAKELLQEVNEVEGGQARRAGEQRRGSRFEGPGGEGPGRAAGTVSRTATPRTQSQGRAIMGVLT